MIEFDFLSPAELIAHKDGLIAAYLATYAEPPYDEPPAAAQEFGDNILMSADRPGFRCVVARRLPENRIVGFVTGSACLPLNLVARYRDMRLEPGIGRAVVFQRL